MIKTENSFFSSLNFFFVCLVSRLKLLFSQTKEEKKRHDTTAFDGERNKKNYIQF